MQNIKQWLKIFLTDLFDINVVLFLTNLTLIIVIIAESNHYGDFIQFLQYLENHLSLMIITLITIFLVIYILVKVLIPAITKKTPGQIFLSTQYMPKPDITILNLFLYNITGIIVNILLLPITLIRLFKGLSSPASVLSQLQHSAKDSPSTIQLSIGIILLVILTSLNIYSYKTNIFFNIGKKLTNYERLMDYAVEQQNPDMLAYFLNEYKIQTNKDPDFYECILSLYKNGLNQKVCSRALKEDSNPTHQKLLHKYIGLHYFNLQDYKNASVYLEYFYNNQLINKDLVTYFYSYEKQDPSYNHKNTITKINKLYDHIKNSNDVITKYKIALILLDNRQLSKAIELLSQIHDLKSPLLDQAEVAWYLGEAKFLNKDYKNGLDYMKKAEESNTSKYKTMYESYLSYYKTQIKK